MNCSPLRLAALLLMLLFAASPAMSQTCGATLSQSTALSADLNCTGHPWALRIDTSGVVLDLRGFTISGSPTGVLVDADDVVIAGPGSIEGAGCYFFFGITFAQSGVLATNADRLVVSGVSFAKSGYAVNLQGTSSAQIIDNTVTGTMHGFIVRDSPGRRGARDNLISRNVMVGDPTCGHLGAWVEGDEATGNLLYANRFENVGVGVMLAASNNTVVSNTFVGRAVLPNPAAWPLDVGLEVAAGSHNTIAGNVINKFSVGVYLSPVHVHTGALILMLDAVENHVIANRIGATVFGVRLGDGGRQTGGVAYKNRIGDNDIRGAHVGLQFDVNTQSNDGRGNGYRGITIPVIDIGTGNQWP